MPAPTEAWWQTPQLHTEAARGEERKVSWLELFYDLVFVVVVSELSHSLATHVSWDGLGSFILLFLPVWWVWISGTIYNDRFETGDVSYRLFVFVQIVIVAAMAVFAHATTGATAVPFALAYIASRLVIIFMWLRGGWYVPAFRPVSTRYAIGFSLSVALFLVSISVPPPGRFALWGLGLLIDLITPIFTLNQQRRLPPVTAAKLTERFGLFTLIVLGEAVVGAVRGVAAGADLTLRMGLDGVLGVALVFALWWIYFDFIARRAAKPGPWWGFLWNYLHLPLLMAITATSGGLLNVLTTPAAVAESNRWLLCGAVGATLLTMAALETALRRDPDEPTAPRLSPALKALAGGGALALGAIGTGWQPPALLTSLLALLIVQMIYGAYVW